MVRRNEGTRPRLRAISGRATRNIARLAENPRKPERDTDEATPHILHVRMQYVERATLGIGEIQMGAGANVFAEVQDSGQGLGGPAALPDKSPGTRSKRPRRKQKRTDDTTGNDLRDAGAGDRRSMDGNADATAETEARGRGMADAPVEEAPNVILPDLTREQLLSIQALALALYEPHKLLPEARDKMAEVISSTPLVAGIVGRAVNKAKTEVSTQVQEILQEREQRISELGDQVGMLQARLASAGETDHGADVAGGRLPPLASSREPVGGDTAPPAGEPLEAMIDRLIEQRLSRQPQAQQYPLDPLSRYRPPVDRAYPMRPYIKR